MSRMNELDLGLNSTETSLCDRNKHNNKGLQPLVKIKRRGYVYIDGFFIDGGEV